MSVKRTWLYVRLTSYRSGAFGIDLFPQALNDFVDLLVEHARKVVVVGGVSFYALEPKRKSNHNLSQHAKAEGIKHRADESGDCIAIAREDLVPLYYSLGHWNFRCWDARTMPSPELLGLQLDLSRRNPRPRELHPTLHLIEGARFYVFIHDNDTLTVEAYGPDLPRAVLTRALQSLVGAAIERNHLNKEGNGSVPEMPAEVIDSLWETSPSFDIVGVDVAVASSLIRLHLVPVVENCRVPDSISYLDYDVRSGRWRSHHR